MIFVILPNFDELFQAAWSLGPSFAESWSWAVAMSPRPCWEHPARPRWSSGLRAGWAVLILSGDQDISGGFLKWGYPQITNFNRIFHYKPSNLGIFGVLPFMETPISGQLSSYSMWTTGFWNRFAMVLKGFDPCQYWHWGDVYWHSWKDDVEVWMMRKRYCFRSCKWFAQWSLCLWSQKARLRKVLTDLGINFGAMIFLGFLTYQAGSKVLSGAMVSQ